MNKGESQQPLTQVQEQHMNKEKNDHPRVYYHIRVDSGLVSYVIQRTPTRF